MKQQVSKKDPDSASSSREQPSSTTKVDETFDGCKIELYHSLGFKQHPTKTIEHVNQDEIVYRVGQHVAIFNYENRTHKFILKSVNTAEILCFAVSKLRKYIALSERLVHNDNVQISVYNLKNASRVRTLDLNGKSPVVDLCFSSDNKYLACVTGEPDPCVYLWQLNKSKKLGQTHVKFQSTQITVSPERYWLLATTGSDTVKIWRFQEGQLKHYTPAANGKYSENQYTFTCHAWFDDEKLLVGTEEGDILVVDGTECKKVLESVHPNSAPIYALAVVDRGFISAGAGGYVSVFERTFDSEYFSQYKRFQTFERVKIISVSVSPKEESIICCYENNQMAHFPLANVDILKENENNFTLLPIGFHGDVITGVDCCIQKSIIATCGNDRTFRLWNYLRRSLELYKKFNEDMFSLALHPNGMRILIGFRYKLSMFDIMSDDLHWIVDWPIKGCRVLKFCTGGHKFAVVSATNILILSSYTFDVITTVRGHSGMVKAVGWSKSDQYMVSAGYEGAVYEWNLEIEKKRIHENVIKTCSFHSIVYDDKNHIIGAIGNDKKVWTFKNSELYCEVPTTTDLTAMCLSASYRTLFVGTQTGKILLYKWPLNDFHYAEYQLHSASVIKIMVSEDEQYIFSISIDGSLFMSELEWYKDGHILSKKPFKYEQLEDITVCLKSQQEEEKARIRELEEKVSQIKNAYETKMQKLNEDHLKDLKRLQKQHQENVDQLNQTIESLKQQIQEIINENKEQQAKLEEEHFAAIQRIEEKHEKEMKQEKERFKKMEEEKDDIISEYVNALYETKQKHTEEVDRLKEEYEQDKIQQIKAFGELDAGFYKMHESYEADLKMTEAEYEKELKEMQMMLTAEIEKEKAEVAAERGKTTLHKKKIDQLEKTIRGLRTEIRELNEKITQWKKKSEEDKKRLENLKQEIQEKDEAIERYEKRIGELTKQATDVEKRRFCLAHNFQKLQKEMAPKEEEIKTLRKRIRGMDKELQHARVLREQKTGIIQHHSQRIDVLAKEITKYKTQLEDKSSVLVLLLHDLSELAGAEEPKMIHVRLKQIVMKYNSLLLKSDHARVKTEKQKANELERQREYMQQLLDSLKKTLQRKEGNHKIEIQRKTTQNTLLVDEINQLRTEKKKLQSKINSLEAQVKTYQGMQLAASLPTSSRAKSATSRPPTQRSAALSRLRTPDSYFTTPRRSGRIIKGNTNSKDFLSLDRNKLQQMIQQIESNNREMERQQEEIRRLKNYIQQLHLRHEYSPLIDLQQEQKKTSQDKQ